jgi:hypothetical protein
MLWLLVDDILMNQGKLQAIVYPNPVSASTAYFSVPSIQMLASG